MGLTTGQAMSMRRLPTCSAQYIGWMSMVVALAVCRGLPALLAGWAASWVGVGAWGVSGCRAVGRWIRGEWSRLLVGCRGMCGQVVAGTEAVVYGTGSTSAAVRRPLDMPRFGSATCCAVPHRPGRVCKHPSRPHQAALTTAAQTPRPVSHKDGGVQGPPIHDSSAHRPTRPTTATRLKRRTNDLRCAALSTVRCS